jgi:putative ABC transport system permease protein
MRDIRDALRSLSQNPLVSVVAILSLALGIGANTALFSILDSLLLKQLPVRAPEQLVSLASPRPGEDAEVSYPIWREVRERRILDSAFVWAADRVSLAAGAETTALNVVWASGGYFDALGIPPAIGRTFDDMDRQAATASNNTPDAGAIAVMGYRFWQRGFGGAPDVIGRTLNIDRVPFTVVGVAPPWFTGLSVGDAFDVVLPLEAEPLLGRRPQRLSAAWPWLHVTGRLRPGQTIDQLNAAFRVVQPQIRTATMPPYARAEDRDAYLRLPWTLRSAATGTSSLRGRYAPALSALLGIVGLVLLIACANLAHLQLARTAARRHEISVRIALGASRHRIARLMLVESGLLSIGGALLGFMVARWGSRLVVAQLSTWYATPSLDLSVDWRVLAVTAVATIATTIVFGTAPALRASRVDPMDALKQRHGRTPGAPIWLGGTLVIGQLAISLLLVAGAGVFARSFAALVFQDLGFDRSRLLVAVLDTRHAAASSDSRLALYGRIRDAVGAVSGVETASASMATPMGNAGLRFTWELGAPGNTGFTGREPRILTTPVMPGWFATYGTAMIAGRDFDERDMATATRVVVVNEAFARRYFGAQSPIGGRLRVRVIGDQQPTTLEIVGLVQDAAFTSVREPVQPTMYVPLAQGVTPAVLASAPSISLSIRASASAPDTLRRSVADAIAAIDPGLSVSFITVSEQLNAQYVRERLLAMISGFFGALALLLAGIGLYGVTAAAVGRRRVEIGIRLALGATGRNVERMVLTRVAIMALLGVAAGVVATLWASRVLQGLVYNTSPRDPGAIALAAGLLSALALGAAWLPARRASRIDPVEVLRDGRL